MDIDSKMPLSSLDSGLRTLVDDVYQKRFRGKRLTIRDLIFMLIDTILDQRFFQSRYWNWRYGGIQYRQQDSDTVSQPRKILSFSLRSLRLERLVGS